MKTKKKYPTIEPKFLKDKNKKVYCRKLGGYGK